MPNYQAKGRPASPEPKKRNINIRVTEQEGGEIDKLAAIMETTKTKAIVKAVRDSKERGLNGKEKQLALDIIKQIKAELVKNPETKRIKLNCDRLLQQKGMYEKVCNALMKPVSVTIGDFAGVFHIFTGVKITSGEVELFLNDLMEQPMILEKLGALEI